MLATIAQDCWTFPSDLSVRRRLFVPEVFSHPAKLHLGLLQRLIDLYTVPGDTILDPMAGTGSLLLAATQQRNVILRDIETSYIEMIYTSLPTIRHRAGLFCGLIDVAQANAQELECPPFTHIITSPPYGFETGTDGSFERRKQRLLSVDHDQRWHRKFVNQTSDKFRYAGGQSNTGNKTGRNYWNDMRQIYRRLAMMLPPEGKLILIVKNHYRRGKLIDLVGQTVVEVENLGLRLSARHQRYIDNPSLWQRRRREAGLPIVDTEDVLVFDPSTAKIHNAEQRAGASSHA